MAPSSTTSPSTALTSESIISWWKDWQSFLRLSLEANALRARMVSTDVFDLDQDDGARREGEIFMKMRPDYIPNIIEEHRKRNIEPRDNLRMIASLRKAGLPVPSAEEVEAKVLAAAAIKIP